MWGAGCPRVLNQTSGEQDAGGMGETFQQGSIQFHCLLQGEKGNSQVVCIHPVSQTGSENNRK